MNPDPIVTTVDPLWGILVRLAVELGVLFIIIQLIYRHFSNKKGPMFAFYLMGYTIFIICIVLRNVELQFGLALGLFAVFSTLRFRASDMTSKDVSYLFTVLGISAVNALFDFPHPVRGTILINLMSVVLILLFELLFRDDGTVMEEKKGKKQKKGVVEEKEKIRVADMRLVYDSLKLLKPAKSDELLTEVEKITGRNIEKIEIRKIDLIRKFAELDLFFAGNEHENKI
jgi:hypothetical protein